MMTLLLMLLAVGATASLAAAVLFLYRYLVRSRLFPQLPRIWGADKKRAIIFGGAALALLIGFVATSLTTRPAPGPETGEAASSAPAAPGEKPLGPSFDGQPPPSLTPPLTHMAREGEAPPLEPAGEAALLANAGLPGGVPWSEERLPQAKAAPAPAPTPAPAQDKPAPTSAESAPPKAEPVKAEPVNAEAVKPEPAKAEPAMTEPVKAEPPAKIEPAQAKKPANPTAPSGAYTVCLSSHKQESSAKAGRPRACRPRSWPWTWAPRGTGSESAPASSRSRPRPRPGIWKKQGVSPDPFLARLP